MKSKFDPLLGQLRTEDEKQTEKVVERVLLGRGGGGGSSSAAITIKDEGTTLTSTPSSMNFTGSGVAATASGNDVTVTINGGGSGTPGGNDTEVQFNDGGSFGGITNATTDGSVMTLTNPVIAVKDTQFTLRDDGDTTKTVNFDLSFITTGTNRLWTFPNAAGTFVGVATSQILTNKTLTSPVINTGTAGTSFNPSSNDGATLGASGTAWSDLFLASGAVIDFAAGDVVLTHSSNTLTMTGGDSLVVNAGAGGKVVVGTVLNVGVMATYNDDTDSSASAVLGGGALLLGAGGSTGADVQISRTAANVLTLASGDDFRVVTAGTDTTSVTVNAGSQTLTNKDISSSTNTYRAASTTATGAVELATTAETDTGTDTTRAVTPDGLSGSVYGTKAISVQVLDGATALTTGDGKAYFRIPPALNGMDLISVGASVLAKSTSGNPTIQIARGRQANATTAHAFSDMLSTRITIDANDFDSKDAATPPVIDTSTDDILTGDLIRIDVDVAGTGATGLFVTLAFRTP